MSLYNIKYFYEDGSFVLVDSADIPGTQWVLAQVKTFTVYTIRGGRDGRYWFNGGRIAWFLGLPAPVDVVKNQVNPSHKKKMGDLLRENGIFLNVIYIRPFGRLTW